MSLKSLNDDIWTNYVSCAYEFLECTPNDTMIKLRENFFYKVYEAHRQKLGCIEYQSFYCNPRAIDDPQFEVEELRAYNTELHRIHQDVTLLCNSYLAILLSRINSVQYDCIIKGLLAGWKNSKWIFFDSEGEYNTYFPLRFPRDDELEKMGESNKMTKDEYLTLLNYINDYSTNDGFMNTTPSLTLVINAEEKYMNEEDLVILNKKMLQPLGRIFKFNENEIKRNNIELYNKNLAIKKKQLI